MKLKKIASLALAGIMAVSMLAGCKDGTNQEDPSSSSQVPTTANVVTYANDALTGAQKNAYTFHDNSALNQALQAVATDKNKCTAKKIEDAYTKYEWLIQDSDLRADVKGKLDGGLTFQDDYYTFDDASVPANNGKTLNYIEVSLLSGELSEKAVAEIAAKYFAKYMSDLANGATVGTDKYALSYSADISAIKVESPQNSAKTAWVVAVMITKTATQQVNA